MSDQMTDKEREALRVLYAYRDARRAYVAAFNDDEAWRGAHDALEDAHAALDAWCRGETR